MLAATPETSGHMLGPQIEWTPKPRTTKFPALQIFLFVFVFVLAGIVVFLGSEFDRDIKEARERVLTGSHLVDTTCGRIEYSTAGEGIPVLAIHGAGGGFDQGLDFFRPLIDRGFKVIAPSRFGYLRTPMPGDASPAAQADAHACLLDALRIRKVAVVGGSAGAPSAMQFCLRHADRCSAMVLLVPIAWREGVPTVTERPSATSGFLINLTLRSDLTLWLLSRFARDFTIKTILATPPDDIGKADADEQQRIDRTLRDLEPISLRGAGLSNDAAIAQSIQRYDLESFRVPTLVFGVADDLFDTFKSASYVADHIPNARFVHYRSGGHLWVGHEKEVCDEIDSFLKTSPAPRRTK